MVCNQNNTSLLGDFWSFIKNIPSLRFTKPPVDEVYQLYQKYPDGTERGVTVFVIGENSFYSWDFNTKTWLRVGGNCNCNNNGGGETTHGDFSDDFSDDFNN